MEPTNQYTRPVKFSATSRYGCGPDGEDDVYTVEEFMANVKCTASLING